MKLLLDNVNLGSASGPNSFGRQLTSELIGLGHDTYNLIELVSKRMQLNIMPDIHLAFIESCVTLNIPLIQRLDGIYYNSDSQYGDWWLQNSRINETYERAAGIIFQSEFSQRLVETFFGPKATDDAIVINNGVDLDAIANIAQMEDEMFHSFDSVWVSASNWRPHKRLAENVRYFLEFSGQNDLMVIAGATQGPGYEHERIVYVGELNWTTLISLYKRAKYFIHLAYHDNCPNVVVDARASGCHIICASCSGTPSIAGLDATVIDEDDWLPQPIELYNPPKLNFKRRRQNTIDSSIDIKDVTRRYIDFMSKYCKAS